VSKVEVWVNGGKLNAEDQPLLTTEEGRAGIVRVKFYRLKTRLFR
jgi:hypothetical protein